MSIITLLLLVSFNAVADEEMAYTNAPPRVREVVPELEAYVSKFEDEFGVKVRFPVRFYVAADNAVASCVRWENGARMVRVDVRRYPPLSDVRKELVVYHELGHCSLNLPHNDEEVEFENVKGKWPASIMRSMLFDDIEALVYKTNRSYYVKELKDASR